MTFGRSSVPTRQSGRFTLFKAGHPTLAHPAILVIGFWLLIYTVYLIAPIDQKPSVSLDGLVFVWSMLLIFCAASVVGSHAPAHRRRAGAGGTAEFRRLARLTGLLLVIGIIGSLLYIYEKVR